MGSFPRYLLPLRLPAGPARRRAFLLQRDALVARVSDQQRLGHDPGLAEHVTPCRSGAPAAISAQLPSGTQRSRTPRFRRRFPSFHLSRGGWTQRRERWRIPEKPYLTIEELPFGQKASSVRGSALMTAR